MTAINAMTRIIGHMDGPSPTLDDAAAPTSHRPASQVADPPGAASPTAAPRPGRRERKVAETRRAILDSARALFTQQGFVETTVEQIVERADVAPRTFFRYFPTKESLLFADFDEVRRAMFATLEARPSEEDPLRSLSIALGEMARVIEARRDELVWGFRLCAEQAVEGVYERTMLKEQTNERVAGFIAERLGVDDEVDPRPMAWAGAIMAVFAAAMKFSATDRPAATPGRGVELLDELLEGTADAMRAVRSA